jgi:hypothetical protein
VGFIKDVANQLRSVWKQDKTQSGADLAKGSVAPAGGLPGGVLAHYGNEYLSEYLRLDTDLMSRYADYEDMDDYPELSTALDIYADDVSQPDSQTNRTVWVTSNDANLKTVLDDLFHRTLRLDEEIWEIARTLVKYGNDFEEILVTEDGVKGLNFLPVPTMRRLEGPHGELTGFIQDFSGKVGFNYEQFKEALRLREAKQDCPVTAFEDWEICHFRLRGKQRRSLYGHSALEPARWIYKRLNLLEDAALVYRLQRAPERYAFYVDVGDLPPAEALAYINKVRMSHRKRRFIDPTTGKLTVKWEPLVQDEDFYVPVRKGVESARIETLGGSRVAVDGRHRVLPGQAIRRNQGTQGLPRSGTGRCARGSVVRGRALRADHPAYSAGTPERTSEDRPRPPSSARCGSVRDRVRDLDDRTVVHLRPCSA